MLFMGNIDFHNIRLLVMDVDGVLTDGGIIIHSDGNESKRFHVMDGHRIKMWQRAGLETAILSGRDSRATTLRAEQLGIPHILQGCTEKLPAMEELLAKTGYAIGQVAYIGDDLMDIPVIRRVNFGAAVANADQELKKYAAYITKHSGGDGAVAEVIEYILKQSNRWQSLIERYKI